MDRRTILSLSIIISLIFHGAMLGMAPRIAMYNAKAVPNIFVQPFRVQVIPALPETQVPSKKDAARKKAGSGSGSIESLLKRDTENLSPSDSMLQKAMNIPQLSDRVASDTVERDHFLAPDQESLRTIDTKVVEISEQTARKDIEIARRMVTPGTNRILAENEIPALRGPSDASQETVSLIAAPVVSLLDAPITRKGEEEQRPESPVDTKATVPSSDPTARLLPGVEQAIARQSVTNQIGKENPYQGMDALLDVRLETFFQPGEKQGFFRLQLAPKKDNAIKPLPRDVTIVIDASSSILQRKLDSTVKGAQEALSQLRPDDQFNIIIFRDTATRFNPAFVRATPANKNAATAFLSKLQSRGETNVYDAIRPVLDTPPRPGVPGIILIATDGRPTAGVRDARTIINSLTEENTSGNTLFAVGGGNTVNRYLLDLLAYRNKGESFISTTPENLGTDLPAFFKKLADPLLVNLHGNYGQINNAEVFPKKIPDFYRGRAVAVYGRFTQGKDSAFTVRISGNAEQEKKEVVFKTDLRQATKGDEQIARNWAFQKVYYLIGEICRQGEQPELLDEVRRLCKQYGLRTIYSE